MKKIIYNRVSYYNRRTYSNYILFYLRVSMIKIFISSTFSDMQAERDAIRLKVLPYLRNYFHKKGYDVSITDLRWGIPNEQLDLTDAMVKILSVCAEEIRSCKPFFVLLLGDRYGTIPDERALEAFLIKHPELTYEDVVGKSITELEILYAMKQTDSNVLVCIRDPELIDKIPQDRKSIYSDPAGLQHIHALKDRISGRATVINYHANWDEQNSSVGGLDEFVDALKNKLVEVISEHIGDSAESAESECHKSDIAFIREQAERYVNDNKDIAEFLSFMEEKDSVLFVKGNMGSGKTCFLAKCVQTLEEADVAHVALFFSNNWQSPDISRILLNMIHRLLRIAGQEMDMGETTPNEQLKSIAQRLINQIAKDKKLVLLLDNVDMLQPSVRQHLFEYIPLPQNDPNYKIVVSVSEEAPLPMSAVFRLPYRNLLLTEVDIVKLTDKLLQENGKALSSEVLKRLHEKASFQSPLYLVLAVKRLILMSETDFNKVHLLEKEKHLTGGEALDRFLLDTIANLPSDVGQLFYETVAKVEEGYGKENVELLFQYIKLGNGQLGIADICRLMQSISHLDLTNLIYALEGILKSDRYSDRIGFAHKIFEEQIAFAREEELLGNMMQYFNAADKNTPSRQRLYLTTALKVGDYRGAALFLSEEDTPRAVNFVELSDELLKADNAEPIIKSLLSVASEAVNLGIKKANTVFQALITEIYFAVNKLTKGTGDLEQTFLYPLYETERALLEKHRGDVDFLRTVYMTAEKCGICSHTVDDRHKYFGDFLSLCMDCWENHSENYPHRNLILSDLGFAYEKCATVSNESGDRWQAAELLDRAISAVTSPVEHSPELKDLLTYQKFNFICAKYSILLEPLYAKDRLHWEIADEIDRFCKNAEHDLNEVIAFCLDAVSDFDQGKRKMSVSMYWNTLIKAYKAMATFFALKKDFKQQKYFLIRAFRSAASLYRVRNEDIIYDLIRNTAFLLGICCACDKTERIFYLNESVQIATKLLETISDDGQRQGMEQFRNNAGGRLMAEYFTMLHPDIDDRNFRADPYEYIKEHATRITDDNFCDMLGICNKYVASVSAVDHPEIFSYESDESGPRIFGGMMLTVINVFFFGTDKIYRDFQVAYAKIKYDLKGAKTMFAQIEKSGEDLIALTAFLAKKAAALMDERLALACSLLIELMLKANHNLLMMSYELKSYEEREAYEKREMLYYAELRFYSDLFKLTQCNEKVNQAFARISKSDTLQMCKGEALGDVRMFSYALGRGEEFLNNYLSSLRGNEPKHPYVYYREMLNFDLPEGNEHMDVVGAYLCKTFASLSTKRLLYYSNFYECLALDHAYQHQLTALAENIIQNGYDRYLELSTLYLIRRYAPECFGKEIDKLKRICLHHRIEDIGKKDWMGCRKLYGDFFCNEVVEKAAEALRSIDKTDTLDPRNHAAKNIPKWAL